MGQSADQIRQEIDENRADAGQKIDDLQGQLQGQAEHMQQQVQDTAEHVRDQVKGTVDDAVTTVQNFDFQRQVQERPLISVGAALVGGFLLGGILGGGDGEQKSGQGQTSSYTSQNQSGGMGSQIRNAAQKSGLEDTISNAAAALMGSITEQLKGSINSNFPGFSEKLDSAQSKEGSFAEKSKSSLKDAQQA